MQTGRQGWGKAHDSFLPPTRRSRLGEGRSYQIKTEHWDQAGGGGNINYHCSRT